MTTNTAIGLMDTIQLYKSHLDRLHTSLEQAVADLSNDQLHWMPGEGCNHIAFSLWHVVRTEDNLINFVLQKRKPTVWITDGWDEVFQLDRVSQGTGMSREDAGALRIRSSEEFLQYMESVWKSTDDYLSSIGEVGLQEIFMVRPMGDRPASDVIMENILTHGFSHLGEMWMLRGLQGFQGSPV